MLASVNDLYTPRTGFKFFDSEGIPGRFLGVELEIAKMNASGIRPLLALANKWNFNIHADGSLPMTGFEINSSPARGKALEAQIQEICKVLHENKAKVTASCGLHVHTDARDMTADDIFKTLIIWHKVESEFFKFCKTARTKSHWCQPMKHVYNHYVDLDKLQSMPVAKQAAVLQKRASAINALLGGDKYTSINFIHLRDGGYGTIENRMHEGSIDADKIIAWSKMNSNLFDFIKAVSLKDAKRISAEKIMDIVRANM
jgi:hypothetical protein